MEIKLINDLSKNYMVIESMNEKGERDGSFEMKMLAANKIRGLLQAEFRSMNGNIQGFYNISSQISFSDKFGTEKMKYDDLRQFVNSLSEVINSINEYLLDGDCVITAPEYIFFDDSKKRYEFCLWPFESKRLAVGLKSLFAYILSVIDYDDGRAVKLAYDLQKQTASEFFVIEDVIKAAEEPAYMPENVIAETSVYDILSKRYEEKAYNNGEYENKTAPKNLSKAERTESRAGFFEKASAYFKEREPGEIFDDINELKIFKKIKETDCSKTDYIKEGYNREISAASKRDHLSAGRKRVVSNDKKSRILNENDDLPLEIIDLREEFIKNTMKGI